MVWVLKLADGSKVKKQSLCHTKAAFSISLFTIMS